MKKRRLLPKRPTLRRSKRKADKQEEGLPRITNETVAAHREEVLGKARKYIYPLQHSKHRVIIITMSLFIASIIGFFTYCTLALYRFQSSSTFIYRVTQVIPFPIARSGGKFVAYENYLFELRHYVHYYESQQDTDFTEEKNKEQLAEFRRRALDKVVNDAYIKQLAEQNDVSVSNAELDQQITTVRNQNRLGGTDRVLEDVLKDYWDWSLGDFRRSLGQQLLAQKVVAKLDTDTVDKANAALTEIKSGADFGEVAKKYSDDPVTKEAGGEFGFPVDRTNRDLTAQTTDTLFNLQSGQVSEVINIGYALEILKNIETNGDRVRGAHIMFNFKDINSYVNDLKEKQPIRVYLKLAPAQAPATEEVQAP